MEFSQDVADHLLEQVATTARSLTSICKDEGMPSVTTIFKWLRDETDDEKKKFAQDYTLAREAKADFLAEEIFEIADDGTNDFMTITKGDETYNVENKEWTSRSKLRVEARKWAASKFAPKRYGDKIQTEHSGSVQIEQITGINVQ